MPLSHIDPANYDALLATKVAQTCHRLAPFAVPAPEIFPSALEGFRMRAEFRMWHDGDALDYVMFPPGEPNTPIPISQFPIACDAIQTLMPALRDYLRPNPVLRQKLFQIEFLSTTSGETLVTLAYHRRLDADWESAAQALAREFNVALVGRSRKQKVVIERDYVTEQLQVAGTDYLYRQYEQAFTQPNAGVNRHMIEWACASAASEGGDLLELYCGNGNFTLPLSRHFNQVLATELAKNSIRAAQWAIAANRIDNVAMIRLAAEEVTQAMNGERQFRRLAQLPQPLEDYRLNTVFVDPPRAGLDPATIAMVQGYPTIIYVSCNPVTLADNLVRLNESHEVSDFALFDQFPYTDHMECGVVLRQRAPR
tara:strand:+ start:35410 stop:36513 length:1104 start_codon:yes stop_codon:yes gene_type:complete